MSSLASAGKCYCVICLQVLKGRLSGLKPAMPTRREHKLTHYPECKNIRDKKACYEMVGDSLFWLLYSLDFAPCRTDYSLLSLPQLR